MSDDKFFEEMNKAYAALSEDEKKEMEAERAEWDNTLMDALDNGN